MIRRVVLAFSALSLMWLVATGSGSSGEAMARPQARLTAIVAHGLRVSLRVPMATYARGSLAQASVTVRNVSRSYMSIRSSVPSCGDEDPWIEVTNKNNKILYPPAVSVQFPPPCKQVPSIRFAPGQQRTWWLYVVVRGRYLRGVVMLQGSALEVKTPPVVVRLVHRAAPRAVIGFSVNGPYADVISAASVHGPMFYQSSCYSKGTAVSGSVNTLQWTPTHRTRIQAGCLTATEWHAVAGWLGQPIVPIDYRQR